MPEYLANLNLLGVAAAVLFLVIAGIVGMTAYQAKTGSLRLGSRYGFTKDEVKASQSTWDAAHRAAWPFLTITAVMAFFHGIACIGVALALGRDSHQMLQVLLVSGLVVTIALYLLAQRVAVNEARSGR